MSSYLEFARIIKVEAICRSFNAIYNYDQNSNEVFGQFNELLMEEEGYLPDELGGVES